MNPLYIILGLTIGNFVYQFYMDKPDYHAAIDRSFFQLIAYLAFLLAGYME